MVAVGVPDQPGGLAEVLRLISEAGVDVEYMYSVFGQVNGKAYMIFRVTDTDKLIAILNASGIVPAAGEELGIH